MPEEHTRHLNVVWEDARATETELYYLSLNDRSQPKSCKMCGVKQRHEGVCDGCASLIRLGRLSDTGVDGDWVDSVVWALHRLSEMGAIKPASRYDAFRHFKTDEELLLWMLVPGAHGVLPSATRPPRDWLGWLSHAGLFEGHRTSRGVKNIADDGHPCLSLFERTIDDFFSQHGIVHGIEPHYPAHASFNTARLRADWILADGTLVEAFGMLDQPAYLEKVERKRHLAQQLNLRVIEVTPADTHRLGEIFKFWMP